MNDTFGKPAGGLGASPSPAGAALSVVLAGGGTAGHVEPAMAVADALSALDPQVRITALGTKRGLETRLVPERGYHLELITPVPLPRKPSSDLARLPPRVWRAVRETRAVLDIVDADVVVGFGGYVALPAYLAALGIRGIPGLRRPKRRIPVVIHEANARAGIANRIGARTADRILSAVPDSGLRRAEVVGVPVRAAITALDRAALRAKAREHFGFADDARVLLVFGGSQGAVSLNRAVSEAAADLAAAGVSVLHAHGPKNTLELRTPAQGDPPYVAVPYLDRMDLAYAAADLVICRSGAMTVAEVSAVRNVVRQLEYFSDKDIPREKIRVVLNRHHKRNVVTDAQIEKVIEQKIFWRVPNHYPQVVKTIHEGDPLAQLANSEVTRSLEQWAAEIGQKPGTKKKEGGGILGLWNR